MRPGRRARSDTHQLLSEQFQYPGKAEDLAGYIYAARGSLSRCRYTTLHGHRMVDDERHIILM
jgi:hypothetical protein